jgi:hypothetical protein
MPVGHSAPQHSGFATPGFCAAARLEGMGRPYQGDGKSETLEIEINDLEMINIRIKPHLEIVHKASPAV